MTLDKGTLIHNRYRVVDILGQGGMGSVYRAIDENLGTSDALKSPACRRDGGTHREHAAVGARCGHDTGVLPATRPGCSAIP